ncbi:site-specific integrase [Planomonospora sp. ID82291]|uniref:tyrosine-type recombinase/integrase n=1 Tax=Planomonospora sp. ID82291 TaxID=2738136 RepID=UPI0018C3FC77|nr:site-specific integrase [Planomonospora sp. ID82291]MBG0818205.1 site-specific integrase [Planomonospora sp. ID82291]
MARVKDLWFRTVKNADDKLEKVPTARNGRGKRWLACWTGPDGREATKAFERKADAERHSVRMEADRHRGTYVDPKQGQQRLREYGEEKWFPSQVHLRSNSVDLYGQHLRTHIYPRLGERRMATLTRSDMKAFVAAISAVLKPSTVATVYAVLRSLMQSAVDDSVIPANPCSRVPLPRAEPRVVEPLSAGQVLALAEAITPRYRLAVWLGAGLGLREGEALGLTVPRVDFLRRKVYVRRQVQGGELVELKTRASKRNLPADDLVLTEITAHMQKWDPGPHQLITTNRCGRAVQRSSFWTCWSEAVEAAGLPKGTRFHDLRHFYASGLIRANLNPKVIQSRLGHATISETMDTYGHLFPDDEDLGRGAIENMIVSAITEQERNSEAK